MSRIITKAVGSTLVFSSVARNNRKGDSLSQALTFNQTAIADLVSSILKVSHTLNLTQSVRFLVPLHLTQSLTFLSTARFNKISHQTINQNLILDSIAKRNKIIDIVDLLVFRQNNDYRVFSQTLTFNQSATVIKIHPTSHQLTFTQSVHLIKTEGLHINQILTFYSYARVYKPDWRFIGGIYP